VSVPPCDLNASGCSNWNVTGLENTNLGEIKFDRPFSGNISYFLYLKTLYLLFKIKEL
jgi:hypothetical protein